MRISEVMSRGVVTIGVEDSCHEAVARMHRAKARHLPVVAADGTLVGIVTDRDVRHQLFAPGVFEQIGRAPVESLLKGVSVGEIMSAPAFSVGADADLKVAATLMRNKGIGSLPVVDGTRLVGIITETDMLRQIVRADAWCCPEVEEIVVSFP
jgi:acetoin utilization protein AcuB